MKEKKTYNHAMDIAFAVPNSQHEDWYDCLKHEKQAVINALQKRLREVFEAGEYLEAIGGIDTYEEESEDSASTPDNGSKATEKVAIDNN
jgi:hypothetical protein